MDDYVENNNYFLPTDDIFTAYLNADNEKHNIKIQDAYDTIFKEQKRNEPNFNTSNFTLNKSNIISKDDRNNLFLNHNIINKYSNNVENIPSISEINNNELDSLKKQKKKAEILKNSTLTSADKVNTVQTSSITNEQNKNIFKTIKIKNTRKKSESSENDIKKLVRLYKNRISAKKCRQKRKEYMEDLEKKVSYLEQELAVYQNMKKNNLMELFLEELTKKENEIVSFNKFKDKSIQSIKIREFKNLQNQFSLDMFKKIIQKMIPLEFKVFANKYIKFADLSNFSTFGELIEKIIENQLILDEVFSLRTGHIDKMNTVPLKIFSFMEKLKEFIFNFQDLLLEIKRFDDIN